MVGLFGQTTKASIYMNLEAWTYKKLQLEEKYGGELSHIIAGIKKGLIHNRLLSMQIAMQNLNVQSSKGPTVVAYLNNLIGNRSLVFRWLPCDDSQPNMLLIRNESIGLIIKADPALISEGIILTPDKDAPFCSLAPEVALSILSSQACDQFTIAKIQMRENITSDFFR